MLNTLKPIMGGLKTHLRSGSEVGTGGTNSARYCYSVWLRHLVLLRRQGLDVRPAVVAELGPGDSIGTGLAALLAGAQTYFALDVVDHSRPGQNETIFEDLVRLFSARSPIPGEREFPKVHPRLSDYRFPSSVIAEAQLASALEPARVERLRRDVQNPRTATSSVRAFAPWHGKNVIAPGSADLVFSQAVLEYVEDLGQTYRALHTWLRPGGVMCHQVDFGAHDGMAQVWNGHWGYSDLTWRLIRGKRSFFLNRQPASAHLEAMRTAGFRVLHVERVHDSRGLSRNQLGGSYRYLPTEDLTTSKAHFIAVKA